MIQPPSSPSSRDSLSIGEWAALPLRSLLGEIGNFRYYRNLSFALGDILLNHLFPNPYALSRKGGRGPYGETPLSTFAYIAHRAAITPSDRVIDLGAGRGRAALWLATHIGCRVTALDAIDTFARRGRHLKRIAPCLTYQTGEIETCDLTPYTLAYHYCFSAAPSSLPRGCRLITFSEPVATLHVIDIFPVRFPWGTTDCYIQCVE